MTDVPADVAAQIDALALDPARPLVVTDADEVLFLFVEAFSAYLLRHGHWLDLTSFKLFGNIKRSGTDELADAEEAGALLSGFFETDTEHMPPVPGAAQALAAIGRHAQIVVLSNLPEHGRAARERALAQAGMSYPLVVNQGVKGPAVARLAGRLDAGAPAIFLDDIPRNIASVALSAPRVTRIHFVAEPRLAGLVEPADGCHYRIDDWPTARDVILPLVGG